MMRGKRTNLVATIAMLASLHGAAFAKTTVPPIPFQTRTLANGLRVITSRDAATPTVAVHVWYKVGSKDDPERRSGFAHLFEHLMFKSTKNMPEQMLDRLTEDVGGWNNASTWDDLTNYMEVVPSNYLESLLWAEADRMSNLQVDESGFHSERDVVKEEFNTSVLAPPYGRLYYAMDRDSYQVHPYKRSTIGSKEDLDAATLDDVRRFHATYYRPDNATLIVVGDFDPVQLGAWVDKYFGRLSRPSVAIPRVTVKEPPRTAERRFDETGPNVPLPAVAVTYLVPPITDEDAPALKIADAILSRGESSRLYQSLVYRQELAAESFSQASLREQTGYFAVGAIAAGGKSLKDVESALLAELQTLQDAPVSAAELQKVINQLVAGELRERETNHGKASALGQATLLMNDPARANSEIERLQAVTADDVQRVAKKYFTETNRVVITYRADEVVNPPDSAEAPAGGTK